MHHHHSTHLQIIYSWVRGLALTDWQRYRKKKEEEATSKKKIKVGHLFFLNSSRFQYGKSQTCKSNLPSWQHDYNFTFKDLPVLLILITSLNSSHYRPIQEKHDVWMNERKSRRGLRKNNEFWKWVLMNALIMSVWCCTLGMQLPQPNTTHPSYNMEAALNLLDLSRLKANCILR